MERLISTYFMDNSRAESMVLGLGGTVDFEIAWSNEIFDLLVRNNQIQYSEIAKSKIIDSERELICTVLWFLANSSGGEVQVSNSEIVKTFSSRFDKKITLGGTGVRAALAMRKFGHTSTLHLVSIDDNVREKLPVDLPYICSASSDTLDPHLIIQFNQNSIVSVEKTTITPSRADRIILTCDPPNEILAFSQDFPSALEKAEIFLISGFNSIHIKEILESRLTEIATITQSLPKSSLIFFEDAGYHFPEYQNIVKDKISKLTDFYSMNEEEFQNYLGKSVDFFDSNSVLDAFAAIVKIVRVPILVIHTKYWSVILGEEFEKYTECVDSGMAMATSRYIYGDDFTVKDYSNVCDLPRNPKSLQLSLAVNNGLSKVGQLLPAFEINCESPTTIGLGDSFVGGFLLELLKVLQE